MAKLFEEFAITKDEFGRMSVGDFRKEPTKFVELCDYNPYLHDGYWIPKYECSKFSTSDFPFFFQKFQEDLPMARRWQTPTTQTFSFKLFEGVP